MWLFRNRGLLFGIMKAMPDEAKENWNGLRSETAGGGRIGGSCGRWLGDGGIAGYTDHG